MVVNLVIIMVMAIVRPVGEKNVNGDNNLLIDQEVDCCYLTTTESPSELMVGAMMIWQSEFFLSRIWTNPVLGKQTTASAHTHTYTEYRRAQFDCALAFFPYQSNGKAMQTALPLPTYIFLSSSSKNTFGICYRQIDQHVGIYSLLISKNLNFVRTIT